MNNNNENQNKKAVVVSNNTPAQQEQFENFIPEWAENISKLLGVDASETLKKQSDTVKFVSDDEKLDVVLGLSKLAEKSQGFFTENELIFMYIVGLKNLMDQSAELQQAKQMLQFFAGIATPMGDETNNE